ncbi:hypothetical protein Pst134EB_021599 [Puccinia striiformis f. sp. tritici]|nr:hypothetical protein Pst134EB_021599 [Puccinia striiformis f. sp. tritici]
MFFDTEEKACAKASLRALKQTKSVVIYTHQFNKYAHDAGWEVPTLISHYKQGLKREVRLAIVVSRAKFETLAQISNLALQIDNELHGAADPITSTSTQAPDPNAMDLSVMRGHLSPDEKARMMRAGLCFRCSTKGHLSRDCPKKKNVKGSNGKSKAVRIAELEEEYRQLVGGTKELGGRADESKNGAAQE